MDALVDTASSTFISTSGFTFADTVSWMAVKLKLVLGSGLGLLDSLMGWIIALVVISAIVYFLFRAFRFFRH